MGKKIARPIRTAILIPQTNILDSRDKENFLHFMFNNHLEHSENL